MINILYLDIDGVLNNRAHDCLLFECEPLKYKLDPYNLMFLDNILERTDTRIILSTSWRNYPDDHVFRNAKGWEYTSLLPQLRNDYKDYIFCDAPHVTGTDKYTDILNSIKMLQARYPEDINCFGILDDDPIQGLEKFNTDEEYMNYVHWFRTSKMYGLNEEITEKVISFFNGEGLYEEGYEVI